jgi:hypothetical protein
LCANDAGNPPTCTKCAVGTSGTPPNCTCDNTAINPPICDLCANRRLAPVVSLELVLTE